MARVSREANIDLSEFFCRQGFGDGDDALAAAVGKEWRDDVVEWLNAEFKASRLEFEAARDESGSLHNDCMITLHPTRDGNGEPIRGDERPELDLDAVDMDKFLWKAGEIDPRLTDVLERVSDRLENEAVDTDDGSLVCKLEARLARIAALAVGEEPRAKDKILALCEEALALIKKKEGS